MAFGWAAPGDMERGVSRRDCDAERSSQGRLGIGKQIPVHSVVDGRRARVAVVHGGAGQRLLDGSLHAWEREWPFQCARGVANRQ